MPRTRVFYAFPGQPANLSETIENAITLLKTDRTIRRKDVRFSPWTDMKVGGRQLVETILKNIDRSDVFACDLTHPNFNVSFELGYAIGRFKRVWISLDSSIETAEQQYRKTFYGIIGAGYTRYHNSQDLAGAFITDNPTNDLEQKLLGETYRSPGTLQEEPVLLYVKPPIITDSVIKTTQVLEDSIFPNALTIDDPIENSYPTLEWYAGKLKTADAVLCHLLGTERAGHEEHNAKCSLLAGLARGFNKPLLMLAQTPFESPIDFRKLLLPHDTASECEKLVRTWIDELQERLPNRRPRRPDAQFFNADDIDLRGLPIGEPVAENERQKLDSYFVETSTYFRSMEEPVTIVVGGFVA